MKYGQSKFTLKQKLGISTSLVSHAQVYLQVYFTGWGVSLVHDSHLFAHNSTVIQF